MAKYIVRASFSPQGMVYTPVEKSADGSAKVVYQSKDGGSERTFDAIDWLTSLVVQFATVRTLKFHHTIIGTEFPYAMPSARVPLNRNML
jgi:hypothetical protein